VPLPERRDRPAGSGTRRPRRIDQSAKAKAVTVVAHAQHGRLDLVEELTDELPQRLSTMLANPVANPPPYLMELPTCGGLLLALAMVDLDRGTRTGDERATRSGAAGRLGAGELVT
jgi:hypothetical protein